MSAEPSHASKSPVTSRATGRRTVAFARRAFASGALALVLLAGACANNPERLPELDRRFYYNLDASSDREAFLRLRDEDRQAFLEQRGLWQKWTALPEDQRARAAQGEVEVGFAEFAVFMAWGPPADTQTRDPDGRKIKLHTFIRCTSGPKVGRHVRSNLDCDGTSSEVQVTIEGGRVVEINYPN